MLLFTLELARFDTLDVELLTNRLEGDILRLLSSWLRVDPLIVHALLSNCHRITEAL